MDLFFKCPVCGGEIDLKERYCGTCGFDSITIVDPAPEIKKDQYHEFKSPKKERLLVLILFIALQLSAVGVYCFLNNKETTPLFAKNQPAIETDNSLNTLNNKSDLTRAETYLPKPGILTKFQQRCPNGEAGVIERISANIFTDKNIVSEIYLTLYEEQNYGVVYHYIKRSEGVYIISDLNPEDFIPSLKNNLRPGLQWEYHDGSQKTVWTVLEMGKTIDLDFVKLYDCLLILEEAKDNDYQKITYYAPGIGRVMEKNPNEDNYQIIMTSISHINLDQATKTIKMWTENYQQVEMLN